MYAGIKATGYKQKPIGQFQTIAEGIKYVKTAKEPSVDKHFERVAFNEPKIEDVKALAKWLRNNPDKFVTLYHGTSSDIPVLKEGLKPTSSKTAKSLQSRRGVVSLSIYPGMAKNFGRIAYPNKKITVYAVEVPVSRLIPDIDQLRNQRYWGGRNIGNTLAESIAYGHGAQIKGAIHKEWITVAKTEYNPDFEPKIMWEIDDSKARVKSGWDKDNPLLYEVLEHHELYEQYPGLKNIRVFFDPDMLRNTAEYHSSPSPYIKMGASDKPLKTLLHEVQHAIQEIEGFPRGGNPEIVHVPEDDVVRQFTRQMDDLCCGLFCCYF
jgi:hypothetical protein